MDRCISKGALRQDHSSYQISLLDFSAVDIGVRTHVYGIRSVVQSVLRLTVARQRTLEHTFKLQRKIASTMMTMPSPALLFLLACDNVISRRR